jgi:uncharacterized membrane protein
MAFGSLTKRLNNPLRKSNMESRMFDIDHLLQLGVFNQLIPIWQVFFFIASLLPFLLLNRVKICLLITYLFTYYLGFMVQWGDYIAHSGSMQPFVLYSLSGLAIAVFFVATIFTEGREQTQVRWIRYSRSNRAQASGMSSAGDPVEMAIDVTGGSDSQNR